jgi:hypothetical protein
MARGGSLTLSDLRTPYVVVVCGPCGRRGRFAVVRLLEKYGDASMPGLLPELTGCPKWRSIGLYDRCRATYDRQDS